MTRVQYFEKWGVAFQPIYLSFCNSQIHLSDTPMWVYVHELIQGLRCLYSATDELDLSSYRHGCLQ